MGSERDEFTRKTIDMLGKRVAFLCSNPHCRSLTIGANEHEEKATIIGIAAHITGASSGGPRYDSSITDDERKMIGNGIWLCANCSILIDRDEVKFTVAVLKQWKEDAENETRQRLKGMVMQKIPRMPKLDIDFISGSKGRSPMGYSNKNPMEIIDGTPTIVIRPGDTPIIYWKIFRNFVFTIVNNSVFPAFNISVVSTGAEIPNYLEMIPRINNIPPYGSLNLNGRYETMIEGNYLSADKIMKAPLAEVFQNMKFEMTFEDESGKKHTNFIEFKSQEIINQNIILSSF
jgi:hypothetical protein